MLKKVKSKLNSDANLKELVSGSAITFVLKLTGMFLSYLVIYLIAKKNGTEGVGYYSLVNRILMLLGLVGALGTNVSILRYVGQFNNASDAGKLGGIYRKTLTIAFPASVVAGILLFFFSNEIANNVFHNESYTAAIQLISFAIPLYTIDLISIEFIRGLKKLKISEFIRSTSRPLVILAALVVYWSEDIGNIYIIYFFCGGVALNMLASLSIVTAHLLRIKHEHNKSDEITYKELFKVSSPMMVTAVVSMLMGSLSIFILEYYATTDEVGVYSVAFRISQLIVIVLTVVNTISAPKFSELFWAKKHQELQRLIHQSVKLMFWLALGLSILVSGASFYLLALFGEDFTSGQIALIILIAGQLFNAATGSVGLFLNMSGNQHLLRNTAIISLVLQIIVAVILIPLYGIMGAAITTTATAVIWNIMNVRYVERKLNIRTYYLPKFIRK